MKIPFSMLLTVASFLFAFFSSAAGAAAATFVAVPGKSKIVCLSQAVGRKSRGQEPQSIRQRTGTVEDTTLYNALKPAAIPLMDGGKALARSGECIIEWTQSDSLNNIYGGALSAVGAQIRNAGDNLAQAAASCRFKTGTELVSDELREAGTQLQEGVVKMKQAIQEANADNNADLARRLGTEDTCFSRFLLPLFACIVSVVESSLGSSPASCSCALRSLRTNNS
jgi:hypothetical protein